ncbi:hypothetical protein [Streptomyces vinaceus]|uniref:hypothetical protein n=1 Tax=Streptomyces vinaceus TaxID=1960 RepID=UPI00381F3528
METIVLIAVIILMIGTGMRWIHLLNARNDAQIETYRFSDPGRGLPACRTTPVVEPTTRKPTGEEQTFLRPGAPVGVPWHPDPPASRHPEPSPAGPSVRCSNRTLATSSDDRAIPRGL